MTEEDRKFLLDLLGTPSPTGWEAAGQRVWAERMRGVADSVESDAYGNTWAILHGNGGQSINVMLEAHADEIGFIVKHIDEKGFLTLAPIGGSDRTIAAARRIRIFGDKGEVHGVIGNIAIHLRDTEKDKVLEWKDHFADIGASSAEDVAALGIRPGHAAIYRDEAEELPNGRFVGRAIDNRISGYLLSRVFAELAKESARPFATTLAVNAVQEEIGSFGARMVSHRLNPHVALVFDVTHATDTPGMNLKEHGRVELGKGPAVAHGAANHPLVVKRLVEVAERENLPLQHEAISNSTRTDADAVFVTRQGIPTALVSLPLRYMHSPTELIDMSDVETAIKLVTGFVSSLTANDTFHTVV
jgi:putative aminopeptidase FrvX